MEKLVTHFVNVKVDEVIYVNEGHFSGYWPKKVGKGDEIELWSCGKPSGITVVSTERSERPTLTYKIVRHVCEVVELKQDKLGSMVYFTSARLRVLSEVK